MAITINDCVRDVLQTLNASVLTTSTGGTTSIDEKFPDNVVAARVQDALNEFAGIVGSTKDHPEQATLAAYTSPLPNQTKLDATVADRVGTFFGVRISHSTTTPPNPPINTYWPAMPTSPDDIRRYLADASVIGTTTPWYKFAIDSGYLYHTGQYAILSYIPATISSSAVPARYKNGIVSLALSLLLPFQGNSATLPAAQHFYRVAMDAMNAIRAAAPSPMPPPYIPGEN